MIRQQHVIRLVGVTVLVAIAAIAIAAGPAAAAVDSTAEYTINADDIANDSVPLTDRTATTTISIDESNDDGVASGDTFLVRLNDEQLGGGHEGAIELTNVTLTPATTYEATSAIEIGNVYNGKNDSVNVTITGDSPADNGTIELELTLNVSNDNNFAGSETAYEGAAILEVGATNQFPASLSEHDTVGTLDITPGVPGHVEFSYDHHIRNGDMAYNDTGIVNASLIDRHGNHNDTVDSGAVNVSLTGPGLASPRTSGPATFTDGKATVTVAHGADITPAVGRLTISGTLENTAFSAAMHDRPLNITIHGITVTHSGNFTADEGHTNLSVTLLDQRENPIPDRDIANPLLEFSLTTGPAGTANISTVGVLQRTTAIRDTTTTGQSTYNFTTRNADTYNVEVEVLPTVLETVQTDTTDTTGNITVSPGTAAALTVEPSDDEVQYHEGADVDVTTKDAHGNPTVPEGQSPRVTVTLEGDAGNHVASATREVTNQTTTFTVRSTGGNITAGIGQFTVTVEDQIDGLNDTDQDRLIILPDGIDLSLSDTTIQAGTFQNHVTGDNASQLSVSLTDETGGDLSGDVVDAISLGLLVDAQTLQDNASGTSAFDATIANTTANGTDQVSVTSLEFTNETGLSQQLAYTSTTAGTYQIEGDLASNDSIDDTTSQLEVQPADIVLEQGDVSIAHPFIGTVSDPDDSVELTAAVRDEFGNNADYHSNDNVTVNITTENGTELFARIIQTDETAIAETDGMVSASLDPDAELATNRSADGLVNANVTNGDSVAGADTVSIEHEVRAVTSQWQFGSIPQLGTLTFGSGVKAVYTYQNSSTGWTIFDGDVSAEDLHNGLLFESNGNARVGYVYNTSADSAGSTTEVEMDEGGFYLLGTNFNISANDSKSIEADLQFKSIDPGSNDTIDDRDFIRVFNPDGTRMAGGDVVTPYDAYWVRLIPEQADEQDEVFPETRGIITSPYNPLARAGLLAGP